MNETANHAAGPAQENRLWAIVVHLLGIAGPAGLLASLIVWLMYRDDPDKAFVAGQAKEALNFGITMAIAAVASLILIVVLIGILLIWVVIIANAVFCIIAAVKVSKGEAYRFPFALRPVK